MLINASAAALTYFAGIYRHGRPDDDGVLNRAEGGRQFLRIANRGIACLPEANPDHKAVYSRAYHNMAEVLPSRCRLLEAV